MARRVWRGNSMIEYILPLGLFFMVTGIAAFMLNLPDQIAGIFADTTNGEVKGGMVQVQAFGSIATPPGARNLPPVEPGQEQVCVSYQLCVNVPIMDGKSSVETAGAMGGDETRQLALVLNQVATRLKEKGADDTLIDMVTRLANSGHELSDSVRNLEGMCPGGRCGTDRTAFNAKWQDVVAERDAYKSMKQQYDAYVAANPRIFDVLPEARDLIDLEARSIIDLANTFNFNEKTVTREQELGEVITYNDDENNWWGGYYGYGGRQRIQVRRDSNRWWGGDDEYRYEYVDLDADANVKTETKCTGGRDDYCRQVAVETTTTLQDIVVQADSEPIRQSSNDICATGGDYGKCLRSRDGKHWEPHDD